MAKGESDRAAAASARHADELERLRGVEHQLRAEIGALAADRDHWRREFTRLRARRVVRAALAVARPLGSLRRLIRRLGAPGGRGRSVAGGQQFPEGDARDAASYRRWMTLQEYVSPAEASPSAAGPLISIVMPVYEPDVDHLVAALESVRGQRYPSWQLVLCDDGSNGRWWEDERLSPLVEDERVVRVGNPSNGGIAAATNRAIGAATGTWVAFMDQDDLLAPDALSAVVDAVTADPGLRLLYSDEDSIDAAGERYGPYFKPTAIRELMLGQNVMNHLTVYSVVLLKELGGLREGLDGSQDWDLNLRALDVVTDEEIAHLPRILYHWRKTDDSFSAGEGRLRSQRAGGAAVAEAMARRGLDGFPRPVVTGGWFQLVLRVAESAPKASIVIPTRDRPELIMGCVDAILARTRYDDYELVIVDNGTRDEDALAYLAELERRHDVAVLRCDWPFNFSRLLNEGVRAASGEVIVSLNNDVIVEQDDWLEQLVANAVRPDVGAVGARLLYADGRVQHAGVVLGVGSVAGHWYGGLAGSDPGYFGQAVLQREVEAVTGAVLAMRRALYLEVGGLDEENLSVAFNDVDLCLRLREMGLRNLYVPGVELTHLESVSRGSDDRPDTRERFQREVAYMLRRWGVDGGDLVDRIKNPNFVQREGDCLLTLDGN